jgi:tight adherence protein B
MSAATGFAVAGGVFASLTLATAGASLASRIGRHGARLLGRADRPLHDVLDPLRRADRGGASATRPELRRLTMAGALAGAVLGWMVAGSLGSATLSVVAALAASRAIGWRAQRYRRRVDHDAAAVARTLAASIGAGRSTRTAFAAAAAELDGAAGAELRRVAVALELGAGTDEALKSFRERIHSRQFDLIAVAIELQRRSGGNLAALLRSIAETIEDSQRLREEARAASAQARFTSTVVLLMPVAGIGLGELASPGLLEAMIASPISLSLLFVAAILQLAAAGLIKRLARIEQ